MLLQACKGKCVAKLDEYRERNACRMKSLSKKIRTYQKTGDRKGVQMCARDSTLYCDCIQAVNRQNKQDRSKNRITTTFDYFLVETFDTIASLPAVQDRKEHSFIIYYYY